MNFFFKLNILFLLVLLLSKGSLLAKEKVKIILKINDEIITNLDIKNEYNYLTALNNDLKKIDKKQALMLAKESIIKEIIKKKEIEKYYNLEKENKHFKNIIKSFYIQLNLNNEEEFKNYLKEYNLDYEDIKYKIKIEATWNQLIYEKYNELVKIDLNKLKKIILEQKGNQNSYLISEIVFKIDGNENFEEKYKIIKKSIDENGFKNSANIYSLSDTSKLGGKIGWVNENQLSKKVVDEIENLKIGEHTKPISAGGGYLILQIDNIKKIKNNNLDVDEELNKLVSYEKNKQLNQLSNVFFNKIRNNTIINEI
tara:strand:- start:2013 stop:2948 length:936 start_codon:yes stop_codon:yes gene_type:complete